MIEELLPASVVSNEFLGEHRTEDLFAEERPLVQQSVPTRRLEFATGRACARKALAALGFPAAPLLSGPKREPLWPDGVRGSITHCRGYVAAAVGRTEDITALGIDAEPHDSLPDGVLEAVSLPEERAWIAEQSDGACWDRTLFSVKESVYKAWFPLTGKWLGFEDAQITFDPVESTFAVRLLVPAEPVPAGPLTGGMLVGFTGRFRRTDDFVLTAVTAPILG